jgi:hypothetical protein
MRRMQSLTIQQPYAHLIVCPQDHLPNGVVRKEVENRTKRGSFRGEFAIHAGKSFNWFQHGDWPGITKVTHESEVPGMAFGAIVGLADVLTCLSIDQIRVKNYSPEIGEILLRSHKHICGPFVYVIGNVRRILKPVACTGAQGWWYVPTSIEAAVRRQL